VRDIESGIFKGRYMREKRWFVAHFYRFYLFLETSDENSEVGEALGQLRSPGQGHSLTLPIAVIGQRRDCIHLEGVGKWEINWLERSHIIPIYPLIYFTLFWLDGGKKKLSPIRHSASISSTQVRPLFGCLFVSLASSSSSSSSSSIQVHLSRGGRTGFC